MEIGILIEFNQECGYGVVGSSPRKYILHEYNRVDLKKGDIIIYDSDLLTAKYHNHISEYCYNIHKLKDKKELVFNSLDSKLFSDYSYLICLVFPELIDHAIKTETDPYLNILNNLDEYLEEFNFKKIINNYKVELYKGGNYKPGRDHTAYAYIESIGHDQFNIYDLYIKDLLPEIRIQTYWDTGVIWSRAHEDYNSEEDEKYALNLHKSILYRAKQLYSKLRHKKSLEKLMTDKISKIREDFNEGILNNFNENFTYHILIKEFSTNSEANDFSK
jgi:hypothetical protein